MNSSNKEAMEPLCEGISTDLDYRCAVKHPCYRSSWNFVFVLKGFFLPYLQGRNSS